MQRHEQEPEKIRSMFAQVARRYDFLNHLLSLNMDAGWRQRLARRVVRDAGGKYLDVCCGTGDQALALLAAGAGEVVGVDFTQEMLDQGAAKTAGVRVSLVQGDAMDLPFDDATFDGATVTFGIRNVSDREKGLREMVRVVRRGGRVGVLEFYLPSSRLLRVGYLAYFRGILPFIGGLLSGDRTGAYAYLPRSVIDFGTPEVFAEQMAKAGLRDISVRRMSGGAVCATIGAKP